MPKRYQHSWRLPWTSVGVMLSLLLLLRSSQALPANDDLAQDQPQQRTIQRGHVPYRGPALMRRDLNGTLSNTDIQPSTIPTQSSVATYNPTTGITGQTSSALQDTQYATGTMMATKSSASTTVRLSNQATASSTFSTQTQTTTQSNGSVVGVFSPYGTNQLQDFASQQSAQSASDSSVSSIESSFMNQAYGTGSLASATPTAQLFQANAFPTSSTVDLQSLPTEQQSPVFSPQATSTSSIADTSSTLRQFTSSEIYSASAAESFSSLGQSSTVVESRTATADSTSRSSNTATSPHTTTSSTSSSEFRANVLFAAAPIGQTSTSSSLPTQATVTSSQQNATTQQPTQSSAQSVDTLSSSTFAVASTSSQTSSQSISTTTSSPQRVQGQAIQGQSQSPTATSTQAPSSIASLAAASSQDPSSQDVATSQDFSQTSSIGTQPVSDGLPSSVLESVVTNAAQPTSNSPFATTYTSSALTETEAVSVGPVQTATTATLQPSSLSLPSFTLPVAPHSTDTGKSFAAVAPEATSTETRSTFGYSVASSISTITAPLSTFSTVFQTVEATDTASSTSLYNGYLPEVLVTEPTSTGNTNVDQVQPSQANSAAGDISQVTPVPASLPAETPGIITPYGVQAMPAGSQPLGGIFFLKPLNYLYLVQNPTAADQIFQFFPKCLASAIGVSDAGKNFFAQSITPYSISGEVVSVLNMFVDPSVIAQARGAILNPASPFYTNPSSAMCGQLAQQINTGLTSKFGIGSIQAFAQAASSTYGGVTNQISGNTGTNPSGSTNSGSLDSPPAGQSTPSVAKPLGITAAGVAAVGAYAAAMVFGMRRYRRRRSLASGDQSTLHSSSRHSPRLAPYFDHRLSSTFDRNASTVSSWIFSTTERSGSSLSEQARSGRAMSEIFNNDGSSPPFSFLGRMHTPRRGSSKPNTITGQDISGPLTSNNSLGWN